MKISANTKISSLIKQNAQVIEVIATINPNFKKLKNPVLRKLLAPRVSIEMAAKIGGVQVAVFYEELIKLGFSVDENEETKAVKNIEEMINKNMEIMIDTENDKITELDVREKLSQGIDPFSEIMATVRTFILGDVLKIVNTFEPVPIINVLKQKGFISKVEKISDTEIHTFLKKVAEDNSLEINEKAKNDALTDNFESVLKNFKGKVKEIDVRELEMPQPMVKILETLKELPDDFCLHVHHKKVPQFLLPQLDERNYVYLTREIDLDNTKMLIYKKPK